MITLSDMAALTVLYNSPDRHYHNMRHINRCLSYLEDNNFISYLYRESLHSAIWFHDAVYNPYSKYNEHYSADLYYKSETCKNSNTYQYKNGCTNHQLIYDMIFATRLHTEDQSFDLYDGDEKLAIEYMLDIDLVGLADDYNDYQNSAILIRKEYYNTSIDDFIDGRKKFLEAMLARKSIYYTYQFKTLNEDRARNNMQNELNLINRGFRSAMYYWYGECK